MLTITPTPRTPSMEHLPEECPRREHQFEEESRLISRMQDDRELLEAAVCHAAEGVWDWNLRSNRLLLSARLSQVIGASGPDDHLSMEELERLVHPQDRHGSFRRFLRRVRKGEVAEAEFRLLSRQGDYHWYRSRGSVLKSDPSGPVNATGVLLDITDQKVEGRRRQRAERKLRGASSELRRFSAIIEQTSDFVWIAGTNLTPRYVNLAGRKMLGLDEHEKLNRLRVHNFYPRSERKRIEEEVLPAVMKCGRWQGETTFLARDGAEIPVSQVIMAHRSRQGKIRFLSTVSRDISERVRAEDAVRERDERLRQRQKLEAVGALAGGVAHEFNNLLQAISGYTQFAMEGLEEAEPRSQDLKQVLVAARRASQLTQQLLGFSRRQSLAPVPLDVNGEVQEMVTMLRCVLGEHIRIETRLSDEAGSVLADPTSFQQMLMNLCVNARDAMPRGGQLTISSKRVHLSEEFTLVHERGAPGPHVKISVTDTGVGMPADVRKQIFEPFFTTKAVGEGTGLGLAMVHGLVEQHGGMIDVYSEVGAGTSFKVYLPAAKQANGKPALSPVRPPGGDETILLAEDEAIVRTVAVRILERAGYSVICAEDGRAAIFKIEEHLDRIQLALLDVVMPHRSGHDVYRRIRALRPDLPVIFCTGYDPQTAQTEKLQEQGLSIIEKPFEPLELLAEIRSRLDSAKQGSGEAT